MRLPIRFAVTASETRSKKVTNETLVNLYPEKSPDSGITSVVLYQASGLTEFCDLGDEPILAMETVSEVAYAITKDKLYRINSDKTFDELHSFGGLGLVGDRVSTSQNGIHIMIVDGIRGFVYNVRTNTLTEITSQTGFYPADTVTFLDGYFIFNRKGTGQFFISGLYDTTTDPLDFATAESAPDDTVAVYAFNGQLFLFGKKTIEVWYNSGNALFPFERISGAVINRGCSAPYSICKTVNALLFVGDDNLVYQISANNYIPQRVSGYSVEKDIVSEPLAYSFAFAEYGHEFYMLQLPNSDKTWCYDVISSAWHERRSPIMSRFDLLIDSTRYIGNCLVYAYDKKLVGSRSNGKVFYIDKTATTENGLPVYREAISAPIFKNNEWLKCSLIEFLVEVNIKTNPNPKAILSWSDDGVKWSDGIHLDLGKIGERKKRVIARRLGRFRQRTFRLVVTDDVDLIILGAFVEGNQ